MTGNYADFRTILIVEYRDDSWKALIEYLESDGYLVLTARDGAEAVQIAKNHSRPIHLLLVDKTSPSLFAELQPYQPGIRILIAAMPREAVLARVRELLRLPEQGAGRE